MLRCTETLDPPPKLAARRRASPDAQQQAARRALPCTPCALPAWATAVATRSEQDAWQLTQAVYTHALSSLHALLPTGALHCDVMHPAAGTLWRGELAPAPTACANKSDEHVLRTHPRSRGRHFVRMHTVIERPSDAPPDVDWALVRVAPRVAHALAPVRPGDANALESVVLQADHFCVVQLGAGRRGMSCFASLRTTTSDRLALSVYIEASYVAHALFERLAHAALRHAALSGVAPTLDWRDAGVVSDGALAHTALAHWYATVAAAHPLAPLDSEAQLAASAARVASALDDSEWRAPPTPPATPPPPPLTPDALPATPDRTSTASPPAKRRALHPALELPELGDPWDYVSDAFSLERSMSPNASQYATV
jgi:hypothetical protein